MRRLRRIAPRRLGTDEEATLVEHLSELRHRLVLGLAALVPAFLLAFAFHSRLIEWLKDPLPPDKVLVTLGVTEPFTTAVKVSLLAAVAIALPILLWQVWAFLAPAMDAATQRVISVFVVIATALFAVGVAFAYFIILPAAIEFLTNFDDSLYDIQIRASYYLTFTAMVLLATGIAFEMPIFILALVRIGVLSSARLRRNRRLGIVLMVCFAILLPTVDPVSLALETIPLLILFESSIWLSVLMERRWAVAGLLDEDDDGTDDGGGGGGGSDVDDGGGLDDDSPDDGGWDDESDWDDASLDESLGDEWVPDADEPELGDDDTESDDDAEAVEAGDGDETART
jgi:sec-independent protein translocase protein TatC